MPHEDALGALWIEADAVVLHGKDPVRAVAPHRDMNVGGAWARNFKALLMRF